VDLRSRSFTADVVQAFFSMDHAYDQYTVDKIEIFNDRSLSPVQKANQIKALRQALPAALQANLDAAEVAPTLQAVTQDWRERSGSVAELRSLREVLVGKEATDRLEDLDRDEQAWQVRIHAYLQARSVILADVSLADDTKQERIQRLMGSGFSASEQLRVSSYERMADQKLAMNPP
jgi:lipase chaperone LimK